MTLTLVHSWYLLARHLRALARQPWYVAITLVQPIIWLLLFGALFARVADLPGFTAHSYLDWLAPGVAVMCALFSGGWSGMGVLDDLERGVMDRFLVSPVRRGALMNGRVGQQMVVSVIQSAVILALGAVAGAHYPGGLGGLAVLAGCAALLAAGFASLSNALALLLRRRESIIAAVQFVVLPLTFLSTAFMPLELLPRWMQLAARWNPVAWAVQAGRTAASGAADWGPVLTWSACLAAFAAACVWLSVRAFRAYQRAA